MSKVIETVVVRTFRPQYRSPVWLRGGHAQTIYPALFAPKPGVSFRRERWDTPDGDFMDIDFTQATSSAPKALLVMFHGLEGNSGSHYAQATMQACLDQGWQGVVPNFRSCSGELNRALRTYHSGETTDIDFVLRRLARLYPDLPRYAIGVSLGGNALCKWLGEQGDAASQVITAAAAFCPPQDLHQGAIALSRGFNLLYMKNFLKTLRGKALKKLEQHPGSMSREHILAARNFFEFDDAVTAKVNGYANCYDYWDRCSSKKFLPQVRTPLLLVNPLNDPFLPVHALARPGEVSKSVHIYYPAEGGHVGFLQGKFPGQLNWIADTAMTFFRKGGLGRHG